MRKFAYIGALVLISFIILGFVGSYFSPGDAAAVGRLQAAALLVPWAALLWSISALRAALFSLAIATGALASILPVLFASGNACTETCLTLYQKNLLSKAWPRRPLADDIILSGAEVVMLQEVSDHNRRYMGNLFDHYSTSVFCKFRPSQDVALLTSLQVVPGSEFCLEGAGLAGFQIRFPGGQPLWVLSLHLEWPFPFDQSKQAHRIAERIEDLDGPVLVAGDFNNAPWSGSVHLIMDAADCQHLGAFRNTFRRGGWLLPLSLDRVLVPKNWVGEVEMRPYFGSDHLGILARVGLEGAETGGF